MYKIPKLKKYKNLFHAFSEKKDGNMASTINGVMTDFDLVLLNRKRFLKKLDVEMNKTVCMWVMHGDEIKAIYKVKKQKSMFDYKMALKVDGLVTNKKGIYLFLLIADCLPIIIYDPVKNAVCLIHAGWKGVDLEISKKAILKMHKLYKSKSEDLIVGIGPCVYKKSFVKENPSQKDDSRWQDFLTNVGENNFQVDLVGFVKKQLIDSGVSENNIFESGINTATDKRFFSHVRDHDLPIKERGRFACVVGLK